MSSSTLKSMLSTILHEMSSKGDKKYNDKMFLEIQKKIFNISKVKLENFVETLGLYLKIFFLTML